MKKLIVALTFWLLSLPAFSAEIMSADVAAKKAASGEIVLIDIRRPEEWKQTGVGAPAHKISMHQEGFLQKLSKLVDYKKDAPIALICRTGNRTTWLAGELEKRGYSNLINVREGMMGSQYGPGWLKRGLPLHPKS